MTKKKTQIFDTIIVGAGPAGLTAGYELSKKNQNVLIFEKDEQYVGGISRTVDYKGYKFDIGGHRFFSKNELINNLWDELLPDDFLTRPRISRIYYNNKFFNYPIKALEALRKLGFLEACLCVLSYIKARLFPYKDPKNFEEWTVNCFGYRLYSIFFKTYTEKVWGMKCTEISADWGAQRIKGLTLFDVFKNSFFQKQSKNEFSTLITSFRYPRKGPGQMWDAAKDKIHQLGNAVEMGHMVTSLKYDGGTKYWAVNATNRNGTETVYHCKNIISTAPISELIKMFGDQIEDKIKNLSARLRYRDFIIVPVIVKSDELLKDNWIYIHDPNLKVGRVQNFKAWSEDLVPNDDTVCYGMEYFCFEGDRLWESKDNDLIELAIKEITDLNLCTQDDVIDATVVRQEKAYPVYDEDYSIRVNEITQYLETHFPTLHLIGRNGMHKYNNQDHAMLTGILTAQNIIAGARKYNVWKVNQDAEYHEEGVEERLVPMKV